MKNFYTKSLIDDFIFGLRAIRRLTWWFKQSDLIKKAADFCSSAVSLKVPRNNHQDNKLPELSQKESWMILGPFLTNNFYWLVLASSPCIVCVQYIGGRVLTGGGGCFVLFCSIFGSYPVSTVKPLYSSHHRDLEKCPLWGGVHYVKVWPFSQKKWHLNA